MRIVEKPQDAFERGIRRAFGDDSLPKDPPREILRLNDRERKALLRAAEIAEQVREYLDPESEADQGWGSLEASARDAATVAEIDLSIWGKEANQMLRKKVLDAS